MLPIPKLKKRRRGELISQQVKERNKTSDIHFLMPALVLPSEGSSISLSLFADIVSRYENDQELNLELGDYDALNALEEWFIQIIEPIPETRAELKEWTERESFKMRGHSWYLPLDCRPYVKISSAIRDVVRDNFRSVSHFAKFS